jgi:hypothetical protein
VATPATAVAATPDASRAGTTMSNLAPFGSPALVSPDLHVRVTAGDAGRQLVDVLVDPNTGVPVNLFGCTVTLVGRADSAATPRVAGTATVVGSPLDGRVSYTLTASDTALVGDLVTTWQVTQPGGSSIASYPTISFDLVRVEASPTASTVPVTVGASAVCSSWCTADDIAARPGIGHGRYSDELLGLCAAAATDTLFIRSGRQFPGLCTASIRPVMSPRERNLVAWAAFLGGYSFSVTGTEWATPLWQSWAMAPAVSLNVYPIVSISEVKIDGVVIPPDEYRIDDYMWLVRVRPSMEAVPTERYGWPTWQDLTLPDTEPSTFSVTCSYGFDVPALGKIAAAALGAYLVRRAAPVASGGNIPPNVQQVTRQGVSIQAEAAATSLAAGRLGIPECDIFIDTVNPSRSTRRPAVWSPELDQTRRTGT